MEEYVENVIHVETRNYSVIYHGPGCTVVQAVSRRLPTTVTRHRSQVKSYGIYGRQSGTGAAYFTSTSVSPANSHSTNCYTFINHPFIQAA
jgi:hypothetical protein